MSSPATLGVLLAIGICVILPICGIVAWAITEARKARLRHEERLAMIERGLAPPLAEVPPAPVRSDAGVADASGSSDPAGGLGWAVGLLVAGVLWLIDRFDVVAVVLIGCGAAYLTRGVMGLLRERGRPSGPQEQPRDSRGD